MQNSIHVSVLPKESIQSLLTPFLNEKEPSWLIDATFGGGGHTQEFLKHFAQTPHRVLGIDKDAKALERGRSLFQNELQSGKLELHHGSFSEVGPSLKSKRVLGVLADLGFSSDQLEDPERGLSFHREGPLDMRLDSSNGRTCQEWLQLLSESELEEILSSYGEERHAKRIASQLITARRGGKLPKTTQELSLLVVKALPPYARHQKIHAATRTFQALRIWVNQELQELDQLLAQAETWIVPSGRLGIISFHSLEDRRVKVFFKTSPAWKPLTKKPIQADDEEIRFNPRARSAKLRVAERMSNERNEQSS